MTRIDKRRFVSPLATDFTSFQADLRQSLVGGPRDVGQSAFTLEDADGRLHGPFGLMLLSPSLGAGLQSLGAAVRFGSELSERLSVTMGCRVPTGA